MPKDQLSHSVKVVSRFQRSIRVDTDMYDTEALEGYVCPPSASNALISISKQVASGPQRAFTLTGPFGGGKSSLAVVLGSLLGKRQENHDKACSVLGEQTTTPLLNNLPRGEDGWIVLPIVGSQQTPDEAIVNALIKSELISEKDRKKGALTLLEEIANKTSDQNGVILLIDEMGKFLEYAATNSGDLFFFQELAERSARHEKKIVTVGFLHQAFDQYASKLSQTARDEWAKIQGRFIDIPFIQTHDETVDLISRAIEADEVPTKFQNVTDDVANEIIKRRPGTTADLSNRLCGAWPLHPVVTALLGPISRRRFGQNQRSTFGFLTSGEPGAFQEFLSKFSLEDNQSFNPARLWDYLQLNLEPLIISSPDGHRWATASDAISRVNSLGSDLHISLAKSIGLIEVFRGQTGLVASSEILSACHPNVSIKEVEQALEDLRKWSAAVYRKHLGAFALFEGSDFDIEAAIEEEILSGLSIEFDDLEARANLRPAVAKKHYINTGSLRWFRVELCEFYELKKRVSEFKPSAGEMGLFLLALTTDDIEQEKVFAEITKLTKTRANSSISIAGLPNADQIRSLSREKNALESILENHPALHGDSIARNEVDTRIGQTEQALAEALNNSILQADWYWRGKSQGIKRLDTLSQFASEIAESYYSQTPIISSELLNRGKPSSSAASARRSLMEVMLEREHEENLGYEGFPADAGLYYTVLKATGLHSQTSDKQWEFTEKKCSDKNLQKLFKKTDELLDDGQLTDLTELYNLWSLPPFGLANGVLPVLALTYMLSRRSELAIHLHGKFRPRWETIIVHDMLADPKLLTVRKTKLSGFREKVLINLHETMERLLNKKIKREAFDVAKAMVTFFMRLPEWVHATNDLSEDAKTIRAILKLASDPNKLLFEDLASAFENVAADNEDMGAQLIAQKVGEALSEMSQAYPTMIQGLKQHLLIEVGAEGDGLTNLADLQNRAKGVEEETGDFRLKSFASRLSNFSGDNNQVESIAGLVGEAIPKKWRDGDLKKAKMELTAIATQFRREEALAHVKTDMSEGHQAIAVVVGTGKEAETHMESANLTKQQAKDVQMYAEQLNDLLGKLSDNRTIQIATLAEAGLKIISSK
ncbi:hypothetical protein [Terasakiella sp. SH-1]|uniref:hypothetical protein n=1 Tax=Terasakiella sp. SH-1 TaxID=2560057 RepID=UPI0010730315|nr:hypothetical protein [Terasakiella sp. SH-1]